MKIVLAIALLWVALIAIALMGSPYGKTMPRGAVLAIVFAVPTCLLIGLGLLLV